MFDFVRSSGALFAKMIITFMADKAIDLYRLQMIKHYYFQTGCIG